MGTFISNPMYESSATINIKLYVTVGFIYYKVLYNMEPNQRKALFAQIEEQKRVKAAQLAATRKLKEWETKESD